VAPVGRGQERRQHCPATARCILGPYDSIVRGDGHRTHAPLSSRAHPFSRLLQRASPWVVSHVCYGMRVECVLWPCVSNVRTCRIVLALFLDVCMSVLHVCLCGVRVSHGVSLRFLRFDFRVTVNPTVTPFEQAERHSWTRQFGSEPTLLGVACLFTLTFDVDVLM